MKEFKRIVVLSADEVVKRAQDAAKAKNIPDLVSAARVFTVSDERAFTDVFEPVRGVDGLDPAVTPPRTRTPSNKVTLYNDGAKRGTFKVWSVWRVGKSVVTEWGPMGKTLQQNTKTFFSEGEARLQMSDIERQKRHKGYRDKP